MRELVAHACHRVHVREIEMRETRQASYRIENWLDIVSREALADVEMLEKLQLLQGAA